MQRFLDRCFWIFAVLLLLGGIAFVGNAVYQVAIGNGANSYFGGVRGVRVTYLSVVVLVAVIAVVGAVAHVIAWFQRRRGWIDQNSRHP